MADDPTEDRTQYDESIKLAVSCSECGELLKCKERLAKDGRDWWCPHCKEWVTGTLDQPCKHGNDPNVCEELECVIAWHHENGDV